MKRYFFLIILFVSLYIILISTYLELLFHRKIPLTIWLVSLFLNVIYIIIKNGNQRKSLKIYVLNIVLLNFIILPFINFVRNLSLSQYFNSIGWIKVYLINVIFIFSREIGYYHLFGILDRSVNKLENTTP